MLKTFVCLLGLCPAVYSLSQIWLLQLERGHCLGADPARELVLLQGQWAIQFLILTLCITPARKMTGWTQLIGFRRMLGLLTFFYATLHLLAYIALFLELDFTSIGIEIIKRPYITLGFIAWCLLLPLAFTSTNLMARRLGRKWVGLHRLVYVIALLVILHVIWLAKSSYLDAFVYGTLLLFLSGYRIYARKN